MNYLATSLSVRRKMVTTAQAAFLSLIALTTQAYTQGTGSAFSDAEAKSFTQYHSDKRAEVNVGAVVWDAGIATKAQAYANHLASRGLWEHSSKENGWGDSYGENLATGMGGGYNAMKGAEYWYNEIADYKKYFRPGTPFDSTSPHFSKVGHYTQMVWQDTKKIGAGYATYTTGPKKGWLVIVCKYDPPGNYTGQIPYGKQNKNGVGSPSPAAGNQSGDPNTAPTDKGSLEDQLVGKYQNVPVTNDWHKVEITKDPNGGLRWNNAAGVSWSLPIKNGELWAGSDCPYGESKLGIVKDSSGRVTSLKVGEGIYKRMDPSPLPIEKNQAADPNAKYYFAWMMRSSGGPVMKYASAIHTGVEAAKNDLRKKRNMGASYQPGVNEFGTRQEAEAALKTWLAGQ